LVEGLVIVAARIEDFGTVEAHVDEVGGGVHGARPFNGVRTDQRHVVGAEQVDEFFHEKTGVADFERVAQGLVGAWANIDASLWEPFLVAPCDRRGCFGVVWKKLEEAFKALRIEWEVRWKLPEDRPEFLV
jgi:hypothetical protein